MAFSNTKSSPDKQNYSFVQQAFSASVSALEMQLKQYSFFHGCCCEIVLRPQVHAMSIKGFGGKAASLLSRLVRGDEALLAVLRGLLLPADVAALVLTAARGFIGGDVEVILQYPGLNKTAPLMLVLVL